MSKKQQAHKRVVLFYMKEVLSGYDEKRINLKESMDMLDLGRSNFFRYLKEYRKNPSQFGISYSRKESTNHRITATEEKEVVSILRAEKKLIDDYKIKQVKRFNFNALALDLARYKHIDVSAETIRKRAISLGFHVPRQRKTKIFRQVETSKTGRLLQHDACLHQWSPYLKPFYLILTVDDHSRRILCARFFIKESSMNHILCVRDVVRKYGIPLAYYTDRHSIFTFNMNKGRCKRTYQIEAEDAEVQWKRVLETLQIQHIIAQSPQAKGKVERKFRYLQDRIVRRCAKAEVTTLEEAQEVLDQEVEYYNEHKKHEVTKQTPLERWDLAIAEQRSVLRPFSLKEGESWKDIFSLEYYKKLNKYGKTKVKGVEIHLKEATSQSVTIRYLSENGLSEVRIFVKGLLLKVLKI